jgi:Na+/proline symporter
VREPALFTSNVTSYAPSPGVTFRLLYSNLVYDNPWPKGKSFLLVMFWSRSTGHGAFAGLVSGTLAAALHFELTIVAAVEPLVPPEPHLPRHHRPGVLAMIVPMLTLGLNLVFW